MARSSRHIILASASPRRRQILAEAGYLFEVREPGEVEEKVPAQATPELLARAKARAKAEVIIRELLNASAPAETLIIGADTLCALGDQILEKPLDRADATRILSQLSGTRHRVITGLCLWPLHGSPEVHHESTWVVMRPLSPEEIAAYVASGEADGKAGAYAIQETGDRFVERLEGSVKNVAGFPIELFERLMHT